MSSVDTDAAVYIISSHFTAEQNGKKVNFFNRANRVLTHAVKYRDSLFEK